MHTDRTKGDHKGTVTQIMKKIYTFYKKIGLLKKFIKSFAMKEKGKVVIDKYET